MKKKNKFSDMDQRFSPEGDKLAFDFVKWYAAVTELKNIQDIKMLIIVLKESAKYLEENFK